MLSLLASPVYKKKKKILFIYIISLKGVNYCKKKTHDTLQSY